VQALGLRDSSVGFLAPALMKSAVLAQAATPIISAPTKWSSILVPLATVFSTVPGGSCLL